MWTLNTSTHTPNIQSSAIPIVLCVFLSHSFVAFGFVAWKYTPYSSYFIYIIGSILPLFDVELAVMMFLRRKPFQKKIKLSIWIKWVDFALDPKVKLFFSKKKKQNKTTNSAQHKWATIKYTSFVWHSYQLDKISKRTL